VKQELSENRISLSVAEIMTLGSHDRQRGIDSATRNGVRGPSKGCLDRVRLLCRSLEKALLISLVAGPRNQTTRLFRRVFCCGFLLAAPIA
ncbi:MAG TPA: hypothetical protein PK405_08210, partial [Hyphomicrobiales bacterium]|nr:hypothetical protein [Hyphomicrobiales bacterium]